MNLVILTFLFLFFGIHNSIIHSQEIKKSSIDGYVFDSETNQPLEGANVFLNGTTLGSSTDNNGYFLIVGVPYGSYKIIVSMIGYEIQKMNVSIFIDQIEPMKIFMKLITYELEQVDVIAEEDETWSDQYNSFVKYFLGTSANAGECAILNPEIINFRYDEKKKELIANADDWIVIENHALGYKLLFNLIDFSLTRRGETFYLGEVLFQELTPSTENEHIKWITRRKQAYNGSLKHFLISLKNGRLIENGFLLYESGLPRWSELTKRNMVRPNIEADLDSLSDWERGLYFDKYVKVEYLNESEEPNYYEFRMESGSKVDAILNSQTSWFRLPHGYMTFDIYGNTVDERSSIKLFGYWGWLRIADMLPRDYTEGE